MTKTILKINLNELNTSDLEKVIIEARNIADAANNMVNARNKITDMIEKSGFTIEQILKAKSPTKKVAPKFVHKDNKNLTWSGRGRTPKWVKKFGVKV